MVTIRLIVLVLVAASLMALPASASALSCGSPPDAGMALEGEVQPPVGMAAQGWAPPQVVDGVVLRHLWAPEHRRWPSGGIVDGVRSGPTAALVLILGASWGGGDQDAPPFLIHVGWNQTWGPVLPLGRAMFQIEQQDGRWAVPLCGVVDADSRVPKYEDQRSWRQVLGLGHGRSSRSDNE